MKAIRGRCPNNAVPIFKLLEPLGTGITKTNSSENLDKWESDHDHFAVIVRGKAGIDRYVIPAPIESKAAALGLPKGERIKDIAAGAVANKIKCVTR